MRWRYDIPIALIVLCLIGFPFFVTVVTLGQTQSLLVNGSFEGSNYMMEDPWGNLIPEVEVPDGWLFGWDELGIAGYLHRPELKKETQTTLAGSGVKFFTTFSTHRAWLYQRVSVTPGVKYRFTFYARVWSSSQDDPSQNVGGSYWVNSCIDPWGESDPYDEGVECLYPFRGLNHHEDWAQWVKFQQDIVAEGPWITVFILGEAEWRVAHNDLYADEATVVQVSEVPTPTSTTEPTGTRTSTPIPSATPTYTPTQEGVVTPTLDLAEMIAAVLTEVARQTE